MSNADQPKERLFVVTFPAIVTTPSGDLLTAPPVKVRVKAESARDAVEKLSLELQRSVRREWSE